MPSIYNTSHASFSETGVAFFNSNRALSTGSGSSKYFALDHSIIEKGDSIPRPRIKKRQSKSIPGYKLNKSKVLQKAAAFYNLPSSKKFLAFYSISFPEGMTDKQAVKVLNIWLTRLREKSKKINYLWIAERQGNGTIHFHALVDRFLNIRLVNYFMAKAIDKLNRDENCGFRNWNRSNYNGVDVKRVFNGKGVSQYLAKYMSKGKKSESGQITMDPERFECRTLGMSRLISALFTKAILRFDNAIRYWDYFKRASDNHPFENAIKINDLAWWIPYRFGIPPQLSKYLNLLNSNLSKLYCS